MPDRSWMARRARDPFLQKAHRDNYRSRAAYKLLEVQTRHHLIAPGNRVLDLGCNPGSWTQVVAGILRGRGLLIGLDLLPTDPVEGADLWQADFLAPTTQTRLLEASRGGFDVILSDMAPSTTGIHHADCGDSCDLVETILDLCPDLLRPGGHLLAKVFEGPEYKPLLDRARRAFDQARSFAPDASLKRSREIYLLARGYKGGST